MKNIHGATFGSIANAIENSEFVVVCMSDKYKQSPVCEMEASYAMERCCVIVPVLATHKYKADGWLGFLTSSLNHIDYFKFGPTQSYDMLKEQMGLHRKNRTQSKLTKSGQLHSGHTLPMDTQPKREVQAKKNNDIHRFQ